MRYYTQFGTEITKYEWEYSYQPSCRATRNTNIFKLNLLYIGMESTMWNFVRVDKNSGIVIQWPIAHNRAPNFDTAFNLFNQWDGHSLPTQQNHIQLQNMSVGNPVPINYGTGNIYECPLCHSNMAERTGKYGKFFACTAWSKTKCPAILNKNGKPNKQTQELMDNKKSPKKQETKSKEKSSGCDTFDMLDL